jgi:hypothetical protein
MDAVVGFIALITCAVEAALLCKSRNEQISYHNHRLCFSPRRISGIRELL